VGQAATLEAQQQIAAQNNAAGIAGQQVAQGQGATTALNTSQQNEQNILQNANSSANNAGVSMQGNINNVNSSNNQGILGGIASGASSALGAIGLNKGGEVSPHGKHKLDFVHKMAKMGLEHFDEGGYTANSVAPAPEIAAPPAPQKSSSGGAGDLAALALKDGGTVQPSPTPQPVATNPATQSNDPHTLGIIKSMASGFAEGGPIQTNPLVTGITNPPGSASVQSAYNSSSSAGGPSIASTPASNMDLSKNAKSGYDQGHGNYMAKGTNAANASLASNTNIFNNQDAGTSQEMDASNDLTQNAAKGGEIWKMHPSQHGQFSAKHFNQYFAKGGESKQVPAMVSPNERYLNPREVEMVKHGADPKKLGYKFPGKDKVPGKNSLKNDTFSTSLEEGGVVIPLEVEKTNDSDKMRLFTLKSLRATGKHKPTHMRKPGA
jgi:hypothetical protein